MILISWFIFYLNSDSFGYILFLFFIGFVSFKIHLMTKTHWIPFWQASHSVNMICGNYWSPPPLTITWPCPLLTWVVRSKSMLVFCFQTLSLFNVFYCYMSHSSLFFKYKSLSCMYQTFLQDFNSYSNIWMQICLVWYIYFVYSFIFCPFFVSFSK